MSVTHFKITELPDINLLETRVDGVLAVINTWYPISLENTLRWDRVGSFTYPSSPLGIMKYVVKNDANTESNVAEIKLNFLPSDGEPDTVSVEITLNDNNPIVVGDHLVTWINSDRMKFLDTFLLPDATSINGQLIKDGTNVSMNQVIPLIQLNDVLFVPSISGGGFPYAKYSIRAGNVNGFPNTIASIYEFTININSLADISFTSTPEEVTTEALIVDTVEDDYTLVIEDHVVTIANAHSNKVADVEFTIDSDFLALNDFNRILFNIDGVEIEKFANEVFTQQINMDELGKSEILVSNIAARNVPDALLGSVKIKILTVNNDIAYVSATDEITILTNIA